jgi:hypothetical protein
MTNFLEWFIHETGLHSLITVRSRDVWLILLSRYAQPVEFQSSQFSQDVDSSA